MNKEITQIKVTEIFSSIQGEGPSVGKPALFIRLHGCNLKCSFCDSKYSWNNKKNDFGFMGTTQLKNYSKSIYKTGGLLVLTGGEPLIQQENLLKLNIGSYVFGISILEIETNGTILPSREWRKEVYWECCPTNFIISPKKIETEAYWKNYIERCQYIGGNIYFKFVVRNSSQVKNIYTLMKRLNINPNNRYLMPCATTREELIEESEKVIGWCKEFGFSFSPRLQIHIWNNLKGV